MFILIHWSVLFIFSLASLGSALVNHCSANKANAVYDYIVVGSGPGGSTVATRLALNNFQVLLIEAGPDYDDVLTRTPLLWPETHLNPAITAQFRPYLYSKAEEATIEYPRGMALGGSAQINAMITLMGNPAEWDALAQMTNDANWSSASIKSRFQPLVENCEYCTDTSNETNTNGWLNITRSTNEFLNSPLFGKNPVLDDLLDAVDSQLPYNPDVNKNITYDSYFYTPKAVSQRTGFRSCAYRRIKDVQRSRSANFQIWTNTFVTKILIDSGTKDACGVAFVQGISLYKASPLASPVGDSRDLPQFAIYAKREIIIAGGQWMSPQLLQLSGIGDEELLRQFGIETIQHLPGVGRNQQDRNEIPYLLKLKENINLPGPIDINCLTNGLLDDLCLLRAIGSTVNNFATTNAVLLSILRTGQPAAANSTPDAALYFAALRFDGFRENWVLKIAPYVFGPYLSVTINHARVQNTHGIVRIQSSNAFDMPLIEMNHFKGEAGQTEITQILDHIRFLRRLLTEGAFAEHVDNEELPGKNLTSDAQLIEYMRKFVWGHHACCTNKMGDLDSDPMAVLNSRGQVKGITNLRVADISIFPVIPGYFPVAPISIACEKIAAHIIQSATETR